ncbi:MAG: DUF4124 domain-containing protein [Candidatus Competibacteraceae bacterium]|nr:MAG: DUF4124 domain-containing protein [Candidatus Competibacteraceae bacterium]
MKPALTFAVVLTLVLPARAQVYKWTDAKGQVHYGGAPPATDRPAQTLDIQSQPTPDGEVDNVGSMRRATRELRELRAVNRGIPVRELDRPKTSRRKKNTPVHIGHGDQARIDNLNSDIRRLSSSTLGSARGRARELRAAKRELRQIYRKYGIKPP